MSVQDVAAIVAAVLRELGKGGGKGGGHGGGRRTLDEKYFRRMDQFSGDATRWKDWNFQFKAAVRSASRTALDAMTWTERAGEDVKTDDIETQFLDEGDVPIDILSGELYDVLCSITSGEAMTVVRTVEDMSGFMAWRALCKRYSPVTPARALSALVEVMNPPKVMDVHLVPGAVDVWTTKVAALEREFEEKLSDRMKLAIMLSMVPADLQDSVFQYADSLKTFDQAKDRLKGIVHNRVLRGQPTPMDIGRVVQVPEVNATGKAYGKGACHTCGQQGHFARECPSKGKGKGYRGACWTCGEEGHPSRECPRWGKTGKGWKGKGDQKGKSKGKGKGWWGKGVWSVEDEYEEMMDWEWDKAEEENEEPGPVNAIDYHKGADNMADGDDGWRVVRGCRWSRGACGVGERTISSIDRDGKGLEVNQLSRGWERIRIQVDSGAIDTVAPKDVAKAFSLRETEMSRRKVGFVAANGSKIDNYGERTVVGYTEGGEGVSMRMTCADVQKVLGSVHRMNLGGNRVVLDGAESYMESKRSGKRTKIHYENGQYALYMWVPSVTKDVLKTEGKVQAKGNRFAILATDEQSGFARPARV